MHRLLATLLAAGSLLTGFAASVSAAPYPSPYSNFAGFYIGGLAGGAWGTFDTSTSTAEVPGGEINSGTIAAFNAAGPQSIKPGSFIGGFDAGYNWQVGNYLAGVEGDIEWLHLSGSAVSGPLSFVPPPGTFTITSNADIDWLATLRGRLGFTSGNWLFYATGGAAFTTLHGNFQFSETFFNSAETASVSAAKTGYTVGGGVETYLWQHWSVKAEYLFVDFGNVSAFGVDTGVPFPFYSFTHSVNLKLNIARLGLNYHF
ncbi:MAG: outer membrane beta-barrel protein [Xanthobacteraceae bacterium]